MIRVSMLTTLCTLSWSFQPWSRYYYDSHLIAMERKARGLRKLNLYNFTMWWIQDLKPVEPKILTTIYWQITVYFSTILVVLMAMSFWNLGQFSQTNKRKLVIWKTCTQFSQVYMECPLFFFILELLVKKNYPEFSETC